MKLDSAFSVVVLPEPVPPQTSMLARARTARARKSSSGRVSVPLATRSSGVKPRRRKRRIVSTGPSSASGGITTFTREPSGRRASHSGSASSTRRPSGARIRSIASRRSRSLANRTAGALEPAAALDPDRRGAAHHHLLDRRVAQQRLQRPEAERPLGDPARELGPRAGVERGRLAVDERPDALRRVLAGLGGRGEQAVAQVGGERVEIVHDSWRPYPPKLRPPVASRGDELLRPRLPTRASTSVCRIRPARSSSCCTATPPIPPAAPSSRPAAASAPRPSRSPPAVRRRGSRRSTCPRSRSPKPSASSTRRRPDQRRAPAGRHPRPAVRARVVRPRLRLLRARAPRRPGRGAAHARRSAQARRHDHGDRGRPRVGLLPSGQRRGPRRDRLPGRDRRRRAGGNALIGRELYPLLTGAGFDAVRVSPRMVYVDASRPDLVEGFTRRTFTAMIEGVREPALAAGITERRALRRRRARPLPHRRGGRHASATRSSRASGRR